MVAITSIARTAALVGAVSAQSVAFLGPAQGSVVANKLPAAEVTSRVEIPSESASWGASSVAMGATMLGVVSAMAPRHARASSEKQLAAADGQKTVISIGKGGFIGGSDVRPGRTTGRAAAMQAQKASAVKVAINGFGRIGRNVFRVWLQRGQPFDLVALNIGSMTPEQAAHLLKYDTVLGTLENDVSVSGNTLMVDGKPIALLSGRDPASLPWKQMGVEVVIESTGAFNSFDGGSKHVEAGAKKVVLTAPGKNCPTYVVGVNEGDYDPKADTVISNASCTTNGMSSVCKVLDEHFGVEYGMMTTTHSYTGDQKILDAGHKDLRRARAAAQNIVPTSTGAAEAVSKVLPQFKDKLSGIAFRVPVPNVSVVDLVVKVNKKTSKEEVNAALKAAAEGPLKGIINYETKPLVSSDFMGTPYSNSVDAALTMVMGQDLVKVVLWYDNEWGYSNRVLDLVNIVVDKL